MKWSLILERNLLRTTLISFRQLIIQQAKQLISVLADALLLQLEDPMDVVAEAAKIASSAGIKTILNPPPEQPLSDDLLKRVSILTPNETETELLTGVEVKNETDALKAASVLLKKGIDVAIITIGPIRSFTCNKGGYKNYKRVQGCSKRYNSCWRCV